MPRTLYRTECGSASANSSANCVRSAPRCVSGSMRFSRGTAITPQAGAWRRSRGSVLWVLVHSWRAPAIYAPSKAGASMAGSNVNPFLSRALSTRELEGKGIYGHHPHRIRIARPLCSVGSGVLLAHRKLFQASDTLIAFRHQQPSHNRGNGATLTRVTVRLQLKLIARAFPGV